MITLLSVNIEGFCSICEPTHLDLNPQQTILIKAPNGSGKSSLFGAIVWGIYGKNIKGVSEVNTWKESQPNDYMGTKVEVFFQRDSKIFKVVRCQNYKKVLEDGAKGNNRLILYEDGVPCLIKKKLELQERINQDLGLSYNLFMSSIMFGQGLQRLITESNSDKKKLFEEIFDLNFLNIAKGIVQDKREGLLEEANEVEHQARLLQQEIESTKGTYFELRERERTWKATVHRERRELRRRQKDLAKKLVEAKKKLTEEIDLQVDVKVKNQQKLVTSLKEKLADAKSLSKVPLEEFLDQVLTLMKNKQYDKAYVSMKKLKGVFNKIGKFQEELEEANERLYELKETRSRLDDIKDTSNEWSSELAHVNHLICKCKEEKLVVKSPKYKRQWEELKKKLRKVDEDYHNKLGDLKDYEWLLNDPLGNNGIKAYLFDSSLDLLNRTLDGYSEVLGFRISFDIDLDSTRKEFVTLIERDNIIIDYDELSGGEKQVCNLAMAFAMFESMSAARGINVAFLDEVFESLSSDNIEIVISLIKHIFDHKSLFLITHHDSLPLSHSKILQVEKHNGLTTIKQL